jgi:tRNA(Ile)-lysidine synthase
MWQSSTRRPSSVCAIECIATLLHYIGMAPTLRPLVAGTYIVAVSGGVDSMALLSLLCQQPRLRLIVAHVNHGIRADSSLDENLVVSFCKSHNIECHVKKLHLGEGVNEDSARKARYAYMRHCRVAYGARAIITAHHRDDLIETALINCLRGTGWRGLAPFAMGSDIVRPLVDVSKAALRRYATNHAIPWREDSTNTDERYLRNYVRHRLMPLLYKRETNWYDDFLRLVRDQQVKRRTIERELGNVLTLFIKWNGRTAISRRYNWIMLPQSDAYELFQAFCRRHLGNSLVRDLAKQALLFIKVARPGKIMLLDTRWQLRATSSQIIVEPTSSVVS